MDVFIKEFIRLSTDENNIVLFNGERVFVSTDSQNGSVSFKKAGDKKSFSPTLLSVDYAGRGQWILEFDWDRGKVEAVIYQKVPSNPIDAITKRSQIADFLNMLNKSHAAIVDGQLYCVFPKTKPSSTSPGTVLRPVNMEGEIDINIDDVETFSQKREGDISAYIETGSVTMNIEILEGDSFAALKEKLFSS